MKKTVLLLSFIYSGVLLAQYTAKDFFTKEEMVWYGLNFSKARMIGQFDQASGAGKASGSDLKNRWIIAWNNVVVMEPNNFELKDAFNKSDIFYDFTATEKQNNTIDPEKLLSFNSYNFLDPKEAVQDIISNLSTGQKAEGMAVTFIVESFNKLNNEAIVYVTIFDIKTKAIFVSERIVGRPSGIGLRNYWAGAIRDIIEQIDGRYYRRWKNSLKN